MTVAAGGSAGVGRARGCSECGGAAWSSCLLLLDAWLDAAAERFAGTAVAVGLGVRGVLVSR